MSFPIPTIQPDTPEQGLSFLFGLGKGQDLYKQYQENKYLPKKLEEELRARQLNNQILEPQAQYAPQLTQQSLLAAQLQNQMNQPRAAHAEDLVQSELANRLAQSALMKQQAQYYGPNVQSEIDYRNAQTNAERMNAGNPLLKQSGIAGQLGSAIFLQQHPELSKNSIPGSSGNQQDLSSFLMNGINTSLQNKQALGDFYSKRTQGYNYSSLPVDQKSALLAQTSGMGIDPVSATVSFMNGKSLIDLAKEKGFDAKNLPEPIYPTTKANQTLIQRRAQALTEINSLNPVLTNAVMPYAQTLNGYSPKQISEAIRGTNPDGQAKYLAARALMPEMSSLRLKAMGGQVGIEALREVTNSSMGNIKAYQSLVTPEIYKKSNDYVDQWLNEAVTAANKVGLRSYANESEFNGVNKNSSSIKEDPLGIRR